MEHGYLLSCVYRISAQTHLELITNVQVVDTTKTEIGPGDALKQASKHCLFLAAWRRGEKRKGGQKEEERRGGSRGGEKTFEPLPHTSPLQTALRLEL